MPPALQRVRDVLPRVFAPLVDFAGGCKFVLPDGREVRVSYRSRDLFAYYERDVAAAFWATLSPSMLVLDIGAHWGLYTLLAASRGARVLSFEPSPENHRVLLKNIILSKVRNVEVRAEAVSDRSGDAVFYDYAGPSWGLSMMSGLSSREFTVPRSVASVTVDALGVSPGVLKIDVEGAELAVLRGASQTLVRNRPMIFLEVHHDLLGAFDASTAQVAALLRELDYVHDVMSDASGHAPERTSIWRCRSPSRA